MPFLLVRSLAAALLLAVAACGAGTGTDVTATALPTTTATAAPPTPSTPPSSEPTTAPATPAQTTTTAEAELSADIDVGGRTLHVECLGPIGTGEPTVLLEAGLGAPSPDWGAVVRALSASHRVCAYDRAGLAMSEPAPAPARTTVDLVTDLRALLDGADIAGPLLLVAHSFGAYPATVFTQRHPDDVAGLVFVDPRGPRVSGGWRDALPPPASDEPAAVAANRQELGAFETDPSLNHEHLDLTASAAEVIAALDGDGPLFEDRPVVVLSAANTTQSWSDLPPDLAATFDTIWAAGQQELADESTAGELTVVPGSGHEIHREQTPVVVAAIEDVLADLGEG